MSFKLYRKKNLAEMRSYIPGESMAGISVNEEDVKNGSPKLGDFIARNPDNHLDQWLVSEKFVTDNYVAIEKDAPETEDVPSDGDVNGDDLPEKEQIGDVDGEIAGDEEVTGEDSL